jgi:hypothetical protein
VLLPINKNIREQLNFTDDELLYDKNSINILFEDIELLELLRQQFKKHNPKDVERRNSMLIFDLVIKYCQYSETLGAYVDAFESSNKSKNPSSTIVLRYLAKYEVQDITKFFKEISSRNYRNLTSEHKEKLIYAFGYHKSSSDKTSEIYNIFHLLEEIAGVYIIYLNAYNAYKHGHRIWYAFNPPTIKSNAVLYIDRQNTPNNYTMDYIPSDDEIITEYIIPRSKDCQKLFELILKNNKHTSS